MELDAFSVDVTFSRNLYRSLKIPDRRSRSPPCQSSICINEDSDTSNPTHKYIFHFLAFLGLILRCNEEGVKWELKRGLKCTIDPFVYYF